MSDPVTAAAPRPPEPRTVRLDPEKLYVAVDHRRRELRISAREVLRQVGERTPSSLSRIGRGTQPSADLLVRLLVWLGSTDVGPYLSPVEPDAAPHTEPTPASTTAGILAIADGPALTGATTDLEDA